MFSDRTPVAVRSSALDEDSPWLTNAGRYTTVLSVGIRNRSKLLAAIDNVVESMVAGTGDFTGHSVIVQEMVTDVVASGVVTTREPNTAAPYLVITFETDGDTAAVTSGRTTPLFAALRHGAPPELLPEQLRRVPNVIDEIVRLRPSSTIEVEFAIQRDGAVNVLQVRDLPFAARARKRVSSRSFGQALRIVREYVGGKTGCLSDMADWNPAEMIGRSPRQLAYSLYRELITRSTWRGARAMFGYYNPRRKELMYQVGPRPYIDIRASLSSLTPAEIEDGVRETILDVDLSRITASPMLHTSIEFDASVSCIGVGTLQRLHDRYGGNLSGSDIRRIFDQLVLITKGAVDGIGPTGLRSVDARLRRLTKEIGLRQGQWLAPGALKSIGRPLAITFAVAARHAFIAESILRDLLGADILIGAEVDGFRRSIHTVAHAFTQDVRRLSRGELGREQFMLEYGHLRPGTYDIRSLPYSHYSFKDLGLEDVASSTHMIHEPGEFGRQMRTGLRQVQFPIAFDNMLQYMTSAIQLREHGKFIYSKFVSCLLEDVAEWGRQVGLTRDDVSYLPVHQIRKAQVSGANGVRLRRDVERYRNEHEERMLVLTPSVLWREDQLFLVTASEGRVSFVGRAHVRGKVVIVGDLTRPTSSVSGHIVCVERADPGYDWLLAAGIVGIVTRYGGPNAHLAVRCAELSIPAAIGCGEALFRQLIEARWIEIDGGSGVVRPLISD